MVNGLTVENCDMYLYFGSPVTSDGSVSFAVKTQATLKMPHVLKFASSIKKNNDLPFPIIKKDVSSMQLSCHH